MYNKYIYRTFRLYIVYMPTKLSWMSSDLWYSVSYAFHPPENGKVIFIGWNMMKIFKVLSVSTVKSGGSLILKLAGHGSLSLLATGKNP